MYRKFKFYLDLTRMTGAVRAHTRLLWRFCVFRKCHRRQRRAFLYGHKYNYRYTCTMKQCDVLTVKNACVFRGGAQHLQCRSVFSSSYNSVAPVLLRRQDNTLQLHCTVWFSDEQNEVRWLGFSLCHKWCWSDEANQRPVRSVFISRMYPVSLFNDYAIDVAALPQNISTVNSYDTVQSGRWLKIKVKLSRSTTYIVMWGNSGMDKKTCVVSLRPRPIYRQ